MKLTTAPKREVHGLTFTQNVGVFPRQVSLEIRHTHPALGLNEVAHQRQRHSQVQDNHFTQQQQQCHYQNLQPQHNVRFHEFFTIISCLFLFDTFDKNLEKRFCFFNQFSLSIKYFC
jgi:hypothetical protein